MPGLRMPSAAGVQLGWSMAPSMRRRYMSAMEIVGATYHDGRMRLSSSANQPSSLHSFSSGVPG